MSLGTLLNDGFILRGTVNQLKFYQRSTLQMQLNPHVKGDTLFWLRARVTPAAQILAKSTVFTVDYETLHHHFGHPSKDVLRKAVENTSNFPKGIKFLTTNPICQGCAEGKMPSASFPPSMSRATRPFEIIHTDLKSFPVLSYHKYKYFISFFDDYTSHGWIIMIKLKSDMKVIIKQFNAMVKNQFNFSVGTFHSDEGGEHNDRELLDDLKDLGIQIQRSVPHASQQNGRAERFNRTIMDKAQAICLDACIPQSWWEFAVLHAIHLYNRMPIKHLGYKTPFEKLRGVKPSISHLCVFGCGAYVFLPEEVRINKLAPKLELMTFIGFADGVKGYLFMRNPNNVVFTAVKALFNEKMFPKCPEMQ